MDVLWQACQLAGCGRSREKGSEFCVGSCLPSESDDELYQALLGRPKKNPDFFFTGGLRPQTPRNSLPPSLPDPFAIWYTNQLLGEPGGRLIGGSGGRSPQ